MNEKLKLRNILGYSSVNFLGSGAQGLMSAWLMYFYTTLCGITPVKAGLIFTAARLIDAVGNPIIGFISDNFGKTKLGKRFGRRKFFMLVGIIVLIIVFPMLWTTGHSFTFYFVANLIYEISYTMIFVPITTLPAEMTQDAAERAKLSGGKQYCGTIANIIAAFIPAQLFIMYGKNSPTAFWYTGLSFGIITAVALAFCYLNVFERDSKDIVYEDSAGSILQIFKKLGVDIASSMRNKSFRLHSVMWFMDCIFKQISGGVFTYFAIFVIMTSTVTVARINTLSAIISCVALFFFIIAAYKFGGPKTYIMGSLITLVSLGGFLVLVFIGNSSLSIILLTIFALINIVGRTGVDYPPIYQMAFIPDIDEAITGKRREGVYNGVNSLFGKVAAAIEAAVLGIVLSACGFKKGLAVQPHSAIVAISVITILVPIVLLAIGCISALYFKLTKDSHKLLVDEVNRVKDGGSKADVTPEAKQAIEELTGWKYEQCFGNNNVGYRNK
jgi:oligogalacturonide transporter